MGQRGRENRPGKLKERLTEHLWLEGSGKPPPPLEYIEFVLCERFHKLPSEIRREPLDNIMMLLTVLDVEGAIIQAKRNEGRSA